jgi:chaperonin cofactor prefoldin
MTNYKDLTPDDFKAKLAEAQEKGRIKNALRKEKAKKALDSSKKATKSALDEASKAAAWFQDKVTSGVHKVMGSEEYKQKALEVNARLTIALSSLEDSIKRRDEEIEQLRTRITELEQQLRKGNS